MAECEKCAAKGAQRFDRAKCLPCHCKNHGFWYPFNVVTLCVTELIVTPYGGSGQPRKGSRNLGMLMNQGILFDLNLGSSFRYALRPARLRIDGYRCVGCRSRHALCVHHRRREERIQVLITVCRTCHARLHHRRVWSSRLGMGALYRLWREYHRRGPVQLALPFKALAVNRQRDLRDLLAA